MKNLKTLLVIAAIGLVGCQKQARVGCQTCKTVEPTFTKQLFSEDKLEQSFDVYCKDKYGNDRKDYNLAFLFSEINSSLVGDFASHYEISKFSNRPNLKINNLVIFYDGSLNGESRVLSNEKPSGFLIYYLDKDKLLVEGFKQDIQKSSFILIDETVGPVTGISTNDFRAFADFIGLSQHGMYSVVSVREKNIIKQFNYQHLLKDKLNRNMKNKAPIIGDENDCGGPCWEIPDEVCMNNFDGTFGCYASRDGDDGPCPEEETSETINSNGYEYVYPNSVLYEIREFLLSSELGLSYIDDYYYIGSIVKTEGLNIEIAISAMNLGVDIINPILEKFVNNESELSLYSIEEADEITSFIDELKSISDDERFNEILDNTINIVNNNVNSSSEEIRQIFN